MINLMIINLGSQYGGVEKHIESFLNFINFENIKVYLVCRKKSKFEESLLKSNFLNEIEVISLDMGKKHIIKSIRELAQYVKDENINIIHSHGITSNLICNMVKNKNVNTINSVHGYSDFDRMDKNFLIRKLFDILERNLIKNNDVLIAVSSDIKKYLIQKRADEKKIIVINHGIDVDINFNNNKNIKKECCIKIGSLGRLEKVKGYDILVKAIYNCIDRGYKNINCKIAGYGSEKKVLQEYIDMFNINKYCELIGYVDDTDEFLSSLDIYIQPSRIESFGISIIEAMKYELPVIATDSGGVSDIIKGDNGILIKPCDYLELADKIIYLIDNYSVRKKLGVNGKKSVYNNFLIKDKVIQYEKILYKLVNTNRRN